jgi:hypothetical protein
LVFRISGNKGRNVKRDESFYLTNYDFSQSKAFGKSIWTDVIESGNIIFASGKNFSNSGNVKKKESVFSKMSIKDLLKPIPVAHACNPIYSGGRDQEDSGSKPAKQIVP